MKKQSGLIQEGADINAQYDTTGVRPLHYVCREGDLRMAALLLDHGADSELLASGGSTPLLHAVLARKPNMVEFLIQRGVKLERPEAFRSTMTYLEYALANAETALNLQEEKTQEALKTIAYWKAQAESSARIVELLKAAGARASKG